MQIAYITFHNLDDEAEGVDVLARRGPVHRYPERVYSIWSRDLAGLDEAGIPYRRLSDAEVRNSPASVVSNTR